MESILADCDPKGIGYKILESESGKIQVENILNKAGARIAIAGHSLGGLFANEITARNPDRIESCYGFSAPGISKKSYDTLKNDKTLESVQAKVMNFQTEGDLVPSAGRHIIGTNFAVSAEAKDAIHAHLQHNLNQPNVTLTLIDNNKESQKLLRRVSEATRSGVGGLLLRVTAVISKAPTWYAA